MDLKVSRDQRIDACRDMARRRGYFCRQALNVGLASVRYPIAAFEMWHGRSPSPGEDRDLASAAE
jgi:hypothetical protein